IVVARDRKGKDQPSDSATTDPNRDRQGATANSGKTPAGSGSGTTTGTGKTPGGGESSGAGTATPTATIGATRMRPPEQKPIPVTREKTVADTKIDNKTGGEVRSADGLAITIPPGSLDQPRQIKVYAARVAMPEVAFVPFGAAEPVKPEMLRAWDIDAGPDTGLYAAPVEVALDIPDSAKKDGRLTNELFIAHSADGKQWEFPQFEIKGNTIVFKTRHLCPLILGANPAYWVALLGAVTGGYYMLRETFPDELPTVFGDEAPFIGLGSYAPGFQVWWSKKVPQADPKTGFKDLPGFNAELEKARKDYEQFKEQAAAEGQYGEGVDRGISQGIQDRLFKARHDLLFPDKVKEAEEALVFAQEYIESRGFKRPSLTLPVYVVSKLDGKDGQLYNPWLGRRYIMIGANLDKNDLYSTALHELFHHYQTGYVWIDRAGHMPLMEASALLMEREAKDHYMSRKGAKIWTDIAQLGILKDGLDGPAGADSTALQRHGYGLSWFLEYLRDEKYSGRKEDFHLKMLEAWAARWINAQKKALLWTVDGNEETFGKAFADFCRRYALEGMTKDTIYGKKYETTVFDNDPYVEIDLSTTAIKEVDDNIIRPWSLQFYKLKPPAKERRSTILVHVPDEWFSAKSPGRSVFYRRGAAEASVADYKPEAKWGALQFPDPGDIRLYIVDTGQTGSGWVFAYKPALIFVLEPPRNVRVLALNLEGTKLKVTWEPPEAVKSRPDLFGNFFVQANGNTLFQGIVPVAAGKYEVDVDLPDRYDPRTVDFTMQVTAVLVENGPISSLPSDPVKMTRLPVITSLHPASGPAGTTVKIKGTLFGPREKGKVTFGGIVAAAAVWSDDVITVTVPKDATTCDVKVVAEPGESNGVKFVVQDLLAMLRKKKHFAVGFAGKHNIQVSEGVEVDEFIVGTDMGQLFSDKSITWSSDTTFTFSGEKSSELGEKMRVSITGVFEEGAGNLVSLDASSWYRWDYTDSDGKPVSEFQEMKMSLRGNIPFLWMDSDGDMFYQLIGPEVQTRITSMSCEVKTSDAHIVYKSTDWQNKERPPTLLMGFSAGD
ncbi:MAG: IPT/TIG domain-containing protein, partial [Planctomycetota bacterium]|nr:IPT/TIG domain-containing protein [Planctomycetota bacterium]